jgi:hypothetical protein
MKKIWEMKRMKKMKIKLAALNLEDLLPAKTARLDEINIKNIPELIRLLGTRGDDVVSAVKAALAAGPKAVRTISVSPKISAGARRSLAAIENMSGTEAQKIQNAVEAAAVEAKQTGKAVTFDMPVKIGANTVDTTFIVTDTGVARLRQGKATNTKVLRNLSDDVDDLMPTTRSTDDAVEEVDNLLPAERVQPVTPGSSRGQVDEVDELKGFVNLKDGQVRLFPDEAGAVAEAERISPGVAKDQPLYTGDAEAIAFKEVNERGTVIREGYLVADGNGGAEVVTLKRYRTLVSKSEAVISDFKKALEAAMDKQRASGRSVSGADDLNFVEEIGRQYAVILKFDTASQASRAARGKYLGKVAFAWDMIKTITRLFLLPGNDILFQPWMRAIAVTYSKPGLWSKANGLNKVMITALIGALGNFVATLYEGTDVMTDYATQRRDALAKLRYDKSYEDLSRLQKSKVLFTATRDMFDRFPGMTAGFKQPESTEDTFRWWQQFKKSGDAVFQWPPDLVEGGLEGLAGLRGLVNSFIEVPLYVAGKGFESLVRKEDRKEIEKARKKLGETGAAKAETEEALKTIRIELEKPEGDITDKINYFKEKLKFIDAKILAGTKAEKEEYEKIRSKAIGMLSATLKPYTAVGWSGYKKDAATSDALDAAGLKSFGGIGGVLKKAASRRSAIEKSAPVDGQSSKVKNLMTSLKVLEILDRLEGLDDVTSASIRDEKNAIETIIYDAKKVKGSLADIKRLSNVEDVADQYRLNFQGKKELEDQKVEEIENILKDVEKISSEDLDKLSGMIDKLKKEEAKEANENKSLDREYLVRVNPAKLLAELLKGE